VLAAAHGLFGERGYEATSLEAILAASGVKRGALYHHFASKQAVFEGVLDDLLRGVAAALDEGYDPEADPVICLRAGCHAWLDFAVDPLTQRIVLLDAPVVLGWERWRQIDTAYFEDAMVRDLKRAGAPGGGATADATLIAGVVMAAVNEIALRVSEPQRERAQALAAGHGAVDLLVDRLIVGVL
jgi:AcrR family transcriptional regulator